MNKQELINRVAELLDALPDEICRAGIDRLSIENLKELCRLLEK